MIFLFRHPAMIVYKNITCEVERHQYWDVPISLHFARDWGPWSDWSKNSACFCHNEIWDMDTWWSGEAVALNTILAADYQIRISTLFESPSHPFICKSVVSKCTVYYFQCTVLYCTVLYCTVVPGLVSVSVCRVIMRHMCPSGRAPGCQSLLEILKTRHSSPSPGPWPPSQPLSLTYNNYRVFWNLAETRLTNWPQSVRDIDTKMFCKSLKWPSR